MSIYVDALVPCLPNAHWRYNESCHMFATTEQELDDFADGLGLRKDWKQGDGNRVHYDLTRNKRQMAIKHGAIEITRKQVVELLHR